MNRLFPTRGDIWLERLQAISLACTGLLTPHTYYDLIWSFPTYFQIIYELHGILFKLSDIPLFVFIFISAIRLVFDAEWRGQIKDTLNRLLQFPANTAWLLLLVWMSIGTLWAAEPVIIFYQLVYTILIFIMALVLVDMGRRGRLGLIITLFVVGAAAHAMLTVLQALHGGSLGLSWLGEAFFANSRGQGLTYNPNTVSGYLVIGLFLGILMLTQLQKIAARQIALAIVVTGCGILATQSRSAILASLIGLMPIAIRLSQGSRLFSSLRTRIVIGVVISLCVLIFTVPLMSRFQSVKEISGRLTFAFSGTWAVIQRFPLWGVGSGNLMAHVDALAAAGLVAAIPNQSGLLLQPAHNIYLTLWAELGIPGLVLFIVGCFPVAKGVFFKGKSAVLDSELGFGRIRHHNVF